MVFSNVKWRHWGPSNIIVIPPLWLLFLPFCYNCSTIEIVSFPIWVDFCGIRCWCHQLAMKEVHKHFLLLCLLCKIALCFKSKIFGWCKPRRQHSSVSHFLCHVMESFDPSSWLFINCCVIYYACYCIPSLACVVGHSIMVGWLRARSFQSRLSFILPRVTLFNTIVQRVHFGTIFCRHRF